MERREVVPCFVVQSLKWTNQSIKRTDLLIKWTHLSEHRWLLVGYQNGEEGGGPGLWSVVDEMDRSVKT